MDISPLFPNGFIVCSQEVTPETVSIGLLATSTVGTCPVCQTPTSRTHSFYQRKLADLSMSGKQVKLLVRLRKFFCFLASCPRKVFAQTCNLVFKPYARRLLRADQQIQAIGLQAGAKPGARLCRILGQPISASTVLRTIRKTPVPVVQTPKRLGVDDFAFRKGCNYGTILIDLDQRKPIDLLPDREGRTLENWLAAHPGVELITRDRSSIYANAVTSACPDAIQVADRWHLLSNLSEAVERFLDGQRSAIRQTAQFINQQSVSPFISPAVSLTEKDLSNPIELQLPDDQLTETAVPGEKRYELYQRAKELQQQGHSIRAIATHLGSSRNTIGKYFKQAHFVPKTRERRSNLLAYEPYLRQRWQDGQTCVRTLFKQISTLGYNGGYTILAAFLSNYPRPFQKSTLPPTQNKLNYPSRKLTRLLSQQAVDWPKADKPFLTHLLNQNESIGLVHQLNLRFKRMMQARQADGLIAWCADAEQIPALKGFVKGIRRDFDAVKEALRSEWSNGQTEGQVNRLKTIKRTMYGKAKFDLLRLRVLTPNWTDHPK